jgi:hypothetical protein
MTAFTVNADNWTGKTMTVRVQDDEFTFAIDDLPGEVFMLSPQPTEECCDIYLGFNCIHEGRVLFTVGMLEGCGDRFDAISCGVLRSDANAFIAAAKLIKMIL